MSENRQYDSNAQIVYFDEEGYGHAAVVTIWQGRPQAGNEPVCNLVFVKDDGTGREQTPQKVDSVAHEAFRVAGKGYWCWLDQAPARWPKPVPTGSGGSGPPP